MQERIITRTSYIKNSLLKVENIRWNNDILKLLKCWGNFDQVENKCTQFCTTMKIPFSCGLESLIFPQSEQLLFGMNDFFFVPHFWLLKHKALLIYTNWITFKYSSSPISFGSSFSFLVLHNFQCTNLMNLLFQFYVLYFKLKVLGFMDFHLNATVTYAVKDISRWQRSEL